MLDQNVQQLIEPVLNDLGLTIWAIEMRSSPHQMVLKVMLDRLDGYPITLDQCAKASREIGAHLDVSNLLTAPYQLEVSSPGLNRALHSLAHFQRYIGHRIKFKRREAYKDQKNWTGMIEKVENDQIFIKTEHETVALTLGEIKSASLLID